MQRLERIQNSKIWDNYVTRREQLEGQGWQELLAFHGSSKPSLASISKTGFMTSYAISGQGYLFFSKTAAVSLSYSQKANGHICPVDSHDGLVSFCEPKFLASGGAMLLCRILVHPSMASGGNEVTINSNDLAYPEYIIHYNL